MCVVCAPLLAAAAGQPGSGPGSGPGSAVAQSRELRLKGDYKGAEQLLRGILAGPLDARTRIKVCNQLGDLLREEDRRDEAMELFDQALNSPEADWIERFGSLLGIADIDRVNQNWTKSAQELNTAADMAREHGSDLFEACADIGLGQVWLDQRDYSRAEPLLRRSLAVLQGSPDVPQERVALALDSLAELYRRENKIAMAEDAWMRELTIHRQVFGTYHPQTAVVMERLAETWSLEGDFDKARDWSRQSLEIMQGKFGERSLAAGSAMVGAGLIEQRANHLDAAADMYGRALDIFRASSTDQDAIKEVGELYAGVLSRMHKGREAKQVMGQIQAFHSK